MSKSKIFSGICGFETEVNVAQEDFYHCNVTIESSCPSVQKMAEELQQVKPFQEITYKGEGPLTFQLAMKHLPHTACPVPVGIIKTIELGANLSLPKNPLIEVSKDDE